MINPETLDLSTLPSLPLSDRKQLPAIPCIYFAISSGTVQYIGMSKNLRNRWVNHHRLSRLSLNSNIAWLKVSDISLMPEIENALIHWFKPPLNNGFQEQQIKTNFPTGGRVSINAYIPENMKQDLEKLARIQRRSFSNLVEVLLESAVNEAKKRDDWVRNN